MVWSSAASSMPSITEPTTALRLPLRRPFAASGNWEPSRTIGPRHPPRGHRYCEQRDDDRGVYVSSNGAPKIAAVLAVTEFRALWLAEAQSIAGDQLAKVALMILVYGRTGSAWWAAAVYALTFLPALAGGLGLAQLADRFPRRSLMVVCATVQAGLVGLMAIPGMPIWTLCVLVVGVGLVQSPALA